MSTATPEPSVEQVFENARAASAAVVIVRPDLALMRLPVPAEGAVSEAQAASMRAMISPDTPRNIAAISVTELGLDLKKPAAEIAREAVIAAGKTIPFFGMLIGLAYIGHRVCVFDGHAATLQAGLRDADVLFIDGALAPKVPVKWLESGIRRMRNGNVLIHDRATFQLKVFRKVGSAGDRIEFATG